MQKNRLF